MLENMADRRWKKNVIAQNWPRDYDSCCLEKLITKKERQMKLTRFIFSRRLRKTKQDCLIYEMLYIRELSPSLNVQSDSIKAKLFV